MAIDRRAFLQTVGILPEIYAGRYALFESKRLPVKTDWLGMLLPLARAEGLEVHAWMWSMPCMIPEIMQQHPDWYNVNAKGESALEKPAYVDYYKFLDPGRPEVRDSAVRLRVHGLRARRTAPSGRGSVAGA